MKISVFGTGSVGQAFATKLVALQHTVTLGTRNVERTLANTEKDRYGTPTISEFLAINPNVKLLPFETAAEEADLVILVTKGEGAKDALQFAGKTIDGKVILDITNPLDFSSGGLPTLFLSNTTSLGEVLQETFPTAKFVKSLNTMYNGVMLNPRMLSEDSTVFLSGNYADAKNVVINLLKSFGWKESEMLDLGDMSTARGTESLLPVWLRIWTATQNGAFNFKVAR